MRQTIRFYLSLSLSELRRQTSPACISSLDVSCVERAFVVIEIVKDFLFFKTSLNPHIVVHLGESLIQNIRYIFSG